MTARYPEDLTPKIRYLEKASDRLAGEIWAGRLNEEEAVNAMDPINLELERLLRQRREMQVERDLQLGAQLAEEQEDEEVGSAMAMWRLIEDVGFVFPAFARELDLDPNTPEAEELFHVVRVTYEDNWRRDGDEFLARLHPLQ